jgi:hypothetical protein
MAVLDSVSGYSGADTPSVFPDGTDGSWIIADVSAGAGDTLSFNWNFLAGDYAPYYDFAFLFAEDPEDGIVHTEILAQIAPVSVSEPSTLLLFGAGLIGLAVYGRKRRKR